MANMMKGDPRKNAKVNPATEPLFAGRDIDPTNPPHYTDGEIECIDAIRSALGHEQFIGFLRGQVLKYHWRVGKKGTNGDYVTDVEKSIWYAERLARELENGNS